MELTEFERLVRDALLEANAQEWAPILNDSAPSPAYSPKYLRWEKKLLTNPSFRKKLARPMWQRVLHAAACILLAVSVAFGGLMAVSPDARAWVKQIFVQWFDTYARFTFSGGAAGQETGDWQTTWLPEGFELEEEKTTGPITNIVYGKVDGTMLYFSYMTNDSGGNSFGLDNEEQEYEAITINGEEAYLTRADHETKRNRLVWSHTPDGIAFKLTSTLDTDTLLRIANGIKPAE